MHKKIADYPDKEDMSTPENAYASIEHAWINEGNAFWPRLSVPKKITRLTEEKTIAHAGRAGKVGFRK